MPPTSTKTHTLFALLSLFSLALSTPQPLPEAQASTPTSTPTTLTDGEAEKQIDCGEHFSKDTTPYTWECVEAVQGAPKEGDQPLTPENSIRDFTSGKCYAIVSLPHETSPAATVRWSEVQWGFAHLMAACARSGPNKDILHRSAGTLLLGPSQRIRLTLSKQPKERRTDGLRGVSGGNGTSAGGTGLDWVGLRSIIASVSGGVKADEDAGDGSSVQPLNGTDVAAS